MLNNAEVSEFSQKFEPPLDPGIAPLVKLLMDHNIHTVESCDGGDGHAFDRPAKVSWHGRDRLEGSRLSLRSRV